MSILTLFGIIVFIGVIVGIIYSYAPIPAAFKTAALVIGIILVLLVAMSAMGILGTLNVQVPQVN